MIYVILISICSLRVGTTYDVSATVTNSAGTSENSQVITETTQDLRECYSKSFLVYALGGWYKQCHVYYANVSMNNLDVKTFTK